MARAHGMHGVVDRHFARGPAQRAEDRRDHSVAHAEHIQHHRHPFEPRIHLIVADAFGIDAEGARTARSDSAAQLPRGAVCHGYANPTDP